MALSDGSRMALGAGGAVAAVVAVVLGVPLVMPAPPVPPAPVTEAAAAGSAVEEAQQAEASAGPGDDPTADAGPDSGPDAGPDSGPDAGPEISAEAGPAPEDSIAVPPPADPSLPGPADSAAVSIEPLSLAPPSMVPEFDVVRIEPDGTGIVAGQALAGMTVAVLIDDLAVEEVVADASGRFVAFLSLAPSDKPRMLSLMADPGGAAVLSTQTVVIAPTVTVMAEATRTEAGPETGTDLPEADPELTETAPETPQADPAVASAGAEVPDPEVPDPEVPDPGEPAARVTDPPEPVEVAGPEVGPEVGQEPPALDATALPVATAPAIPAIPSGPVVSDGSATGPAVGPVPEPAPPEAPAPLEAPALADAPDDPPVVVAEIAPAAPVPEPVSSPPLLMVDAGGVRVLQPSRPPVVAPELLRTVALDAISYDDSGDVTVAGRATSEGSVRLYLDNVLVGDAVVLADGSWSKALVDVPAGIYTLRADQVNVDGIVVSRIETPFLREERATIAAVMAEETAEAGFNVAVRTVQPGNTLWAIARDRYGEGILYVAVFEANKDLIRDPDLIYPGQVFRLPELETPAPE